GPWLRLHAIAPAVHAVVPAAQTLCWPVLHASPPPGLPSSVAPSQSLSMPSQTSALGVTLRLHAIAPPMHAVVPAAQTPGRPVLHEAPPPGLPSSVLPLQLLSRPSQTSGLGATLRLQITAPAVHAVVPAAQTPSWPVLHAAPPPGLPLSTVPLQSLS